MSSEHIDPKAYATEHDILSHSDKEVGDPSPALKLDPHGYPLRPQPSDDPLGAYTALLKSHVWRRCADIGLDPLNWSRTWKLVTLLQVSFLSFLGPFTQGFIVSSRSSLFLVVALTSGAESSLCSIGKIHAHYHHRGILQYYPFHCDCGRDRIVALADLEYLWPATCLHFYINHRHCCRRWLCHFQNMGNPARCACDRRYRGGSRNGNWRLRGLGPIFHA